MTILGALGGLEFFKWLFNRKTLARRAEAEADGAEFAVLKEQIVFMQEQLLKKEERFDDQTSRLRECQEREFKLMSELNKANLELALKRCDIKKCSNRQPPNGY